LTAPATPALRGTLRLALLLIVVAGLGLSVFGVVSAQRAPIVARYSIAMPGLSAPLRIVQLSDSHASAIDMPVARLGRVVAQINALQPDVVLLTGDYVSGDPDRWGVAATEKALAPFKALQAPLGVYAVNGNHDNPGSTSKALRSGPVRLLVGEAADVGPVTIVGADSIQRGTIAVEAMRKAIHKAPKDKPVLVIVHEPIFFTWLYPRRPVLMIAGHTHGGQVVLPLFGPIMLPTDFYRSHRRGVFREGIHTLLVSSGLGTTAIPVRIGVPPEIVELTLVPVQPGRNSGTDR
jgi:uncharacterized protein